MIVRVCHCPLPSDDAASALGGAAADGLRIATISLRPPAAAGRCRRWVAIWTRRRQLARASSGTASTWWRRGRRLRTCCWCRSGPTAAPVRSCWRGGRLRARASLLRRAAERSASACGQLQRQCCWPRPAVDDRRATTSWWLAGLYRQQRYPRVDLARTSWCGGRPVTTTGAATAGYEATMRLIRTGRWRGPGAVDTRAPAAGRLPAPEPVPYISPALAETRRRCPQCRALAAQNLHEASASLALAAHCRVSERPR